MKNLIDRQGYQTNYAHEEGVIFEQTNNEWSEIYTDTVAEYLYWSDAYNLFILANVGEPTLYNFEALDETFADFCTEHNIEPSDIFTDFTDDQLFAIFNILKPSFDEMEDATLSGTNLEIKGNEYLFGTDSEMDELWDEYLDNYIDECILPELPEAYRQYFDDEKWKSDASYDGRAHSLASYDGNEESYGDYYFYRTN